MANLKWTATRRLWPVVYRGHQLSTAILAVDQSIALTIAVQVVQRIGTLDITQLKISATSLPVTEVYKFYNVYEQTTTVGEWKSMR